MLKIEISVIISFSILGLFDIIEHDNFIEHDKIHTWTQFDLNLILYLNQKGKIEHFYGSNMD